MDLFSLHRPLGFVLGGSGSLGAVQVGMLRALAERDLFPDLVVGTSVGSLNGAVVALDPTGATNRLSRIWPRITRQMVFPSGPLAQLRTLQQGRTHLFPNTAVQAVIRGYLAANAHFAEPGRGVRSPAHAAYATPAKQPALRDRHHLWR